VICIAAFEQGGYYRIWHWTGLCPELNKAGNTARIIYFAPMPCQRIQLDKEISWKQRAQSCLKLFGFALSDFLQGQKHPKILIFQILACQIGGVRLAMNEEPAQMRQNKFARLVIHL